MATPDWLLLGLGIVQVVAGSPTGSNGVSADCQVATYKVGEYPAQGTDKDIPCIWVSVFLGGSDVLITKEGRAGIATRGTFSQGDDLTPPTIANVYMRCYEQPGDWSTADEDPELVFSAQALPEATGPPDDPRVKFFCQLELKIPLWDNVLVSWETHIDSNGRCYFEKEEFRAGKCQVRALGHQLHVNYDSREHGVDTAAP